jgi:hypothetical protein
MFGLLGARSGGLGLLPGGLSGPPVLVNGPSLHPALTFTRASAGAILRSTDGALVEVGNNLPRLDPALGVLIEEQRTNGVRNPRAEGASPGTPGTAPTNWFFNRAAGLAANIVGIGTTLGVPWVDVRISGTTTDASLFLNANFDTNAGYPAVTNGQTVSHAVHAAIVAGSLPGGGLSIRQHNLDASRVTQGYQSVLSISPTGTLTRYRGSIATSQAGVGFCGINVWTDGFGIGQTMDFTTRLGLPQVEINRVYAIQPILPASGTPAASTRLAERLSALLANIGIGANGACTIVGTFMVPQFSGGSILSLFQLDNGGSTNRYILRTSGATVSLLRVTGGASASGGLAGAITAGVPFKVAFSIDGAGRVAASLNGGAVGFQIGGPTSGLTTLRIGVNDAGLQQLDGYVTRLVHTPTPTADGGLPALSAP